MKSYSEKLRAFSAAHPCGRVTAAGASFHYVLCGAGERTLVLLNGGDEHPGNVDGLCGRPGPGQPGATL